jgi:hypothetical protein
MVEVSDATRVMAGVLFLTIPTIEFGGWFLLRIATGKQEVTEKQRTFFRAGHAHAGVFVILALLSQLFVDAADISGVSELVARDGVAAAALLVPGGFFLSVARAGATAPNRLVLLIPIGMASLAAGVITTGIALIASA